MGVSQHVLEERGAEPGALHAALCAKSAFGPCRQPSAKPGIGLPTSITWQLRLLQVASSAPFFQSLGLW